MNPRFVKWLLVKTFAAAAAPLEAFGARNGQSARHRFQRTAQQEPEVLVQPFAGTFASWTARYSIVNCLILAFHSAPIDNFVVFARQVIMGIIILFSPTPGGSGLAEFMFTDFLGEFIPRGLSATLGLLWRLISYYPYLFIGAIILPRWIRKRFSREEARVAEAVVKGEVD